MTILQYLWHVGSSQAFPCVHNICSPVLLLYSYSGQRFYLTLDLFNTEVRLRFLQRVDRSKQGSVCAMQLQWTLQRVRRANRELSGRSANNMTRVEVSTCSTVTQVFFVCFPSRTVSLIPLGTVVNDAKRVTMGTQPEEPAVPVRASSHGTSQFLPQLL